MWTRDGESRIGRAKCQIRTAFFGVHRFFFVKEKLLSLSDAYQNGLMTNEQTKSEVNR